MTVGDGGICLRSEMLFRGMFSTKLEMEKALLFGMILWCELGPLFKIVTNRSMYTARLSRDMVIAT